MTWLGLVDGEFKMWATSDGLAPEPAPLHVKQRRAHLVWAVAPRALLNHRRRHDLYSALGLAIDGVSTAANAP